MPLPQEKAALDHIAAHSRLPEAWLRYLAAFPHPESDPLSPPWDEGPEAWNAATQRSEHCVSANAVPTSHPAAQRHIGQQASLPLEQSIAAAEERAASAPTTAPMVSASASASAPRAPYEMPLAPFFVLPLPATTLGWHQWGKRLCHHWPHSRPCHSAPPSRQRHQCQLLHQHQRKGQWREPQVSKRSYTL